jgi:hypothetical protein
MRRRSILVLVAVVGMGILGLLAVLWLELSEDPPALPSKEPQWISKQGLPLSGAPELLDPKRAKEARTEMLGRLSGARSALRRAETSADKADLVLPSGPGRNNEVQSWYYLLRTTEDEIGGLERDVLLLTDVSSPAELGRAGHLVDLVVEKANHLERELREIHEYWQKRRDGRERGA